MLWAEKLGMLINTLVYFGVSGFIIWFIQSQKIFDYIFFAKFMKEIRSCGICLGFWVCFVLMPVFDILLFENWYQYIISWLTLSALSSFLIFLVRQGYKAHYGITVVK